MTIRYEWDVEEWDVVEDGQEADILDHDHRDTLKELEHRLNEVDGKRFHLVLVRDVFDKSGDMTDRSWAYVKKVEGRWALAEYFDDTSGYGKKVAKKFHAELKAATGAMQ